MNGTVIPLVFEEQMVRSVMIDDEPWFTGKDVCSVLGIAKHHQALERLDADERGTCNVGTPQGRQEMIVVSEAGAFRLIFTSRKPEAERFKRWLAHEVLPTLRRTGSYIALDREEDAIADDLPSRRASGDHIAELTAKTAAVREARILMGRAFAARVWQELDMPAAGDMRSSLGSVPPLLEDEAFSILVDLLSAPDRDGVIVADQVARAVELKRSDLIEPLGLKLVWRIAGRPCREGALFVANRAPAIAFAFAGTSRETDAAQRLRDIPGAASGHARIAAIGFNGRGTIIPADQLARALELTAERPDETGEVA